MLDSTHPSTPVTGSPSADAASRRDAGLRMTFFAATQYLVSVAALVIAQSFGLIPDGVLTPIVVYDCSGALGFYLLVRSGWDEHLGARGLAVPQMMYALASLGLAYSTIEVMRGAILLLGPLILMFAAMVTKPRNCQRMGWFGVFVLALPIGVIAWRSPEPAVAHGKVLEMIFLAVVYPAIGSLAAQLSGLRRKLKRQQGELLAALDRIQQLATRDDLTGLPNRRLAVETMRLAIESARRRGAPLCIGLIDLDHFKRVNDTHGHAAGDAVLRLVAQEGAPALRQTDLLARWGGEEFLVLLPDTDAAAAATVLGRVRECLAASSAWHDTSCPRTTFSAGVALLRPDESQDRAFERADQLLYRAKAQGRDRIAID